ncbi:MAG: trypsin-like serine peptidase, partial [Anaerolineales bacterium]
ILLLLTIVFILSGTPGSASQAEPVTVSVIDLGGGNISPQTISTLSSADSQPWTRERMLAAQPYPIESLDGELDFSLQLSQPAGQPVFIPGSPPAADPLQLVAPTDAQSISQAVAFGYDYPAPYARYQNFDSYQVYPYSTVGVLFFTQYGVDYRCSAASIGNYAIWTAGHCIHKGNKDPFGWSSNLVFVPAYKDGNTPLGVWRAIVRITTNSWYESGDLRFDMGGALLNEYYGQSISEYVGSLGFAYNMENSLHWLNMAYPSSAPFDGQTQQICAGSFAYADTNLPAPSPVAMGCDMTGGSSGGPWILNFSGQAGGTNYLNGHNSYRYTNHPQELFSPYFGDEAYELYVHLQNGIPHNLFLPLLKR